MDFNGPTTTLTAPYTPGGAKTFTVSNGILPGSTPSYGNPINCAVWRSPSGGTGYLVSVYSVVGGTATTLTFTGPATGFADQPLFTGDIVQPYYNVQEAALYRGVMGVAAASAGMDSIAALGYPEFAFPAHAWGTLAGTTATNATLYLAKWIPKITTNVASLAVYLGTAGTTPTAADNWIALFNSAGTQIALSADQTTAFATAGYINAAMVTPVTVVPGATYYIGFVNTAGTAAKLLTATSPVTAFNAGYATSTLPYATNGTSVTTMSTTITTSSNVVTNALAFWWGINGTATS